MKRKYILLWVSMVLSLALKVSAQSTVNSFSKFNIRSTSCEVLNAINVELSTQKNQQEFLKLRAAKQAEFSVKTKADIDEYIIEFNDVLGKTKRSYESQEFLWKTGKELGKYGLSVLGNYAEALPTKHLTNFITPAIQQGFELYVDSEIQNGIEQHKDDIDQLIKNRINLLYSNGLDVTRVSDENSFQGLFALAHSDIPSLDRGQYAVFNKELTKRAYDYIKNNREQVKLLNLKVDQQYESVLKAVSEKTIDLQKQITNDVNTKFKELGESIADLAKNQVDIYNTLDNIKSRVQANERKIRYLETEMAAVKDDIGQLNSKQKEHDILIAQNAFQIDVLSGYAFQGLDTQGKIAALQRGDFDNIFKKQEKITLLSELETIRTKETIISVSADIENYSKSIYGGLVNAGILKGKAAQNVGKFISTVSIATGLARVFAGDFSGFSSIVSGLGSLFGKPQASAEMQMLTQMFDVMNERFDAVQNHLITIETKIDTLTSITLSMYKNMALSFQYTGRQIEILDWKVNNLNKKATTILYKDYSACRSLRNTLVKQKRSLNSYSDYGKYYGQECKQCLQALSDFTIGRDDSYFFVSSNENLRNESVIKNEILELYEPTIQLFKIFYEKDMNNALNALMFPFDLTSNSNKAIYFLSRFDNIRALDHRAVLENYLSYPMIAEFSNFMLYFANYFLIKGNNESFEPMQLSKYLENADINMVNKGLLELRLKKLLELVQHSIAQQSLMSGSQILDPIYSALFSANPSNESKDIAIKILSNNKLIATNFATLLINKNIDLSDTVKVLRLMTNASVRKESLDSLNRMVSVNDIEFVANNTTKGIDVTFKRGEKNINIECKHFSQILKNKMIYSEGIYDLQNSRKTINEALVSLTFTEQIKMTGSSLEKFKYNYQESYAPPLSESAK